jgi:hypothetical protein
MATALTIPTTSPYTSGDITLSAGSTIVFSITGVHTGGNIEVRKKDSQGAYWVISEMAANPDLVKTGVISGAVRVVSVSNPSATAMTIQVFKPQSGSASGIDQD